MQNKLGDERARESFHLQLNYIRLNTKAETAILDCVRT